MSSDREDIEDFTPTEEELEEEEEYYERIEWFSGKGRSGKINQVLRMYLRARLGDNEGNEDFIPEKSKTHMVITAYTACQETFGQDHPLTQMLFAMYTWFKEEGL